MSPTASASIGAGVIGSLFAGHLAQVADVCVLTRRREHADALNRDGLRISGRAELQATVLAHDDPDELPPFDIGIIATKAAGLEGAAARSPAAFPTRRSSRRSTASVPRRSCARPATWPIVSGVTFISGTKHSDTHVEYVLDTETWLGPYEGTPFARVEEIGALHRIVRASRSRCSPTSGPRSGRS